MTPFDKRPSRNDPSMPADLSARFEAVIQELKSDPELAAAKRSEDEARQAQADLKQRRHVTFERRRRARLRISAPQVVALIERLEQEKAQIEAAFPSASPPEQRRMDDRIITIARALADEAKRISKAADDPPPHKLVIAAPPADREEWRAAETECAEAFRSTDTLLDERLADAVNAHSAAQRRAVERVTPRLLSIYGQMVRLQAAVGVPLNDVSGRVHSMAERMNRLHPGMYLAENLSFPFFRQNPGSPDGRSRFESWLETYANHIPDIS